ESEERYRKLIETSPDSIILTDLKGNITLANQQAASMYGVEQTEDLIGLNMMDFTSHEDRKRVFETLGRVFTESKFETLEYTMLTKEGTRFPAELGASVVLDKNGKPIALMVVSRNISERRKAEKTIKESEEKFRQIFNNANDAIFIHELTKEGKLGNFIEVNNIACEWTGYTREQLLELSPIDIDRPELVEQTRDIGKELKTSGSTTFEGIIAHKDGMIKSVEFSSHLFLLKDEVVILSIARDITDRRKAREELIESEEKFRQIFNNANDGIFLTKIIKEDRTSPFIEVNEVACTLLSYSKEELLKMRSVEITAPEERDYNSEIIKEIYNKGHGTFETVLLSKDQRRIPIELSSHLFTLKDEKVVLSIARDITERKKAESAIQESEERYRKLVETSPDGIVVTDLSGDIIMTNLQGAKYYGTEDVNEIIGLNAFDLIDSGDHAQAAANLEKTLEEGKIGPVEYTFLRKNGETYPAELSASVMVDEENKPFAFVATVRDITERKKAEAQILESEEKYRQLFHNAQDIIAVVDVPRDGSVGKILDVNDVACSKTSYPREEMIGLDIREIVKDLTAEEITSYFKEMLNVDFITFERDFVKKDKETFPVEIQAAPFTLRDEITVLITARDITERKRDEELKKRAYAQIEQNIDNFEILVDRIRNPLTSIIGYSELSDTMHSEIIIEEARKIEEIAQQMSDSWVDSEEFREILRKHMLDNAEKVKEL
ncbi:MAG: PAS domain S-box protein, partial [Candidatus Thorarchaeota archaeon]